MRDANYYEPTTPDGQTYIAGFFYSVFNEYFDRNVMTIDAFDWLHRTGANPPDDSTDPDYQACSEELEVDPSRLLDCLGRISTRVSSPTSTSTLEYYEDADETSWVNEGLSDWAQTLVGYVDPSVPRRTPTPTATSSASSASRHPLQRAGELADRLG